jgi:putative addiction module antidote
MLRVQLRRVGNSCGVILPAELLRYMHLSEGDTLDVSADAHRIVLSPERVDEEDFQKVLAEVMEEDRGILAELAKR